MIARIVARAMTRRCSVTCERCRSPTRGAQWDHLYTLTFLVTGPACRPFPRLLSAPFSGQKPRLTIYPPLWHHRSKLMELQLRPGCVQLFRAHFIESSLRQCRACNRLLHPLIYANFAYLTTNRLDQSSGKIVSILCPSIYAIPLPFFPSNFPHGCTIHGGD